MLSDRQLRRWTDFLHQQILELNSRSVAHAGEPRGGTPEVVAFLRVNDGIFKESVERAVSEFTESGDWPGWLNLDELMNLTHRATLAHGLLAMMYNGQMMHARALPMPKSRNRATFVRWLFIELWQYGGAHYLEGVTNSFFADGTSPESEASG